MILSPADPGALQKAVHTIADGGLVSLLDPIARKGWPAPMAVQALIVALDRTCCTLDAQTKFVLPEINPMVVVPFPACTIGLAMLYVTPAANV